MNQLTVRVWNRLQVHAGVSSESPIVLIATLVEHLALDSNAISDAIKSLASDGAVELLTKPEIGAMSERKKIKGQVLVVDFTPSPRLIFLRIIPAGDFCLALKAKRMLIHQGIEELERTIYSLDKMPNDSGVTPPLKWDGATFRYISGDELAGFLAAAKEEWTKQFAANKEELRQKLEALKNIDAALVSQLALIPEVAPDRNVLREVIPKDVRNDVWRRDQGKCVQCGSQERLEYDHVIPVSKGGANTARNIQLLCEVCNRKKSDAI